LDLNRQRIVAERCDVVAGKHLFAIQPDQSGQPPDHDGIVAG